MVTATVGSVLVGAILWIGLSLRRVPAVISALNLAMQELARAANPELASLKDRLNELQTAVAAQQLRLEGFHSMWRQEAERAETAYSRARAALSSARRAQRETEESLERDVPGDDAEGGAAEAVPPMRARMAPQPPAENPLETTRRALLMRQMGRRA